MEEVIGIISLFVILLIAPSVIGAAGAKRISLAGSQVLLAALPLGFFIILAIFQLLTFPWAMLNLSFTSLCITYIGVITILLIVSFIYNRRKGRNYFTKCKFTIWEGIYGVVAILIIGWQIYNMIHLDIGYWSSDDALYGAIPNDALTYNTLFRHDALTGIAGILRINRAMQGSLLYPAFLSFVSGVPVATVLHTVLGVYYLLLAYAVYAFLGKILFHTNESALVFIIILSVLYIFGLYTIYSQTYRLLGPSTQGKAVLAVVFFPLLFALIISKMSVEYDRWFGVCLLLLSAAAVSMTLFGIITMIGNIVFPVIASLIGKKRNWKTLCYILWGCALPALYGVIYFYSRMAP